MIFMTNLQKEFLNYHQMCSFMCYILSCLFLDRRKGLGGFALDYGTPWTLHQALKVVITSDSSCSMSPPHASISTSARDLISGSIKETSRRNKVRI